MFIGGQVLLGKLGYFGGGAGLEGRDCPEGRAGQQAVYAVHLGKKSDITLNVLTAFVLEIE